MDEHASLLDTDKHAIKRHEVFEQCQLQATRADETGADETSAGYAIAFVLFDISRQLVELTQAVRNLGGSVSNIAIALEDDR